MADRRHCGEYFLFAVFDAYLKSEYRILYYVFSFLDIRAAARNCPPLAMAIAVDLSKGNSHETSTFIEFPVVEIASLMGWNSAVVKSQLKNLEWTEGTNADSSETNRNEREKHFVFYLQWMGDRSVPQYRSNSMNWDLEFWHRAIYPTMN